MRMKYGCNLLVVVLYQSMDVSCTAHGCLGPRTILGGKKRRIVRPIVI
jgi:hypothetical protein